MKLLYLNQISVWTFVEIFHRMSCYNSKCYIFNSLCRICTEIKRVLRNVDARLLTLQALMCVGFEKKQAELIVNALVTLTTANMDIVYRDMVTGAHQVKSQTGTCCKYILITVLLFFTKCFCCRKSRSSKLWLIWIPLGRTWLFLRKVNLPT